ncbi:hypothetical protein RMATCC62417_07030 [Rhizopus microsporus]|nr:hypothetical protein RMATCC62417_07030 [Rhizopus microsporus]
MLKTISDEFYLGTIEVFSKLKALFVYAVGTTVYIWSLKYVQAGSVYELWLEGSLGLEIKFDKAVEQLPKVVNFYWTMKCLLQQTVDVVRELEAEHRKMLKQYRFTSFPAENLSSFVNPSIMKLTEAEGKTGMSEIGPFYI